MTFDADVKSQTLDRPGFSSIERYALGLFGFGIIGLLQSGSETLATIGLIALVPGIVGIILGVAMSGKPILTVLERITILGMFVGIVGMLQPWEIRFYELGFLAVGLSTLAFIVVSHFPVHE